MQKRSFMLILDNVTIYLQDFSSVICVHLTGASLNAIEERYFSFWNHQATGGELEWENDIVSPYHASFWVYECVLMTPLERLLSSMARASLAEMLAPNAHQRTKGQNLWPQACRIATKRLEQIERVQWLKLRTEVDFGTGFHLGDSVKAEKGTGNFDDEVLANVLTRGGSATLDMMKVRTAGYEDETETETEDIGEIV